jgi:hypothetical protein
MRKFDKQPQIDQTGHGFEHVAGQVLASLLKPQLRRP